MNLAFSFHHLFLRFDIFEFQVFHNFIFCFSFADYIHFTLFLNIFENYFELMAAFKHTQNVFLTNAQISLCTLFGLVWFGLYVRCMKKQIQSLFQVLSIKMTLPLACTCFHKREREMRYIRSILLICDVLNNLKNRYKTTEFGVKDYNKIYTSLQADSLLRNSKRQQSM